ncbi:coatomer subunit delta [Saccoglossus kowalevskii]|uniref:Coatomer subunit delta n=1 Tax=Saccoglossus kowalevskii TaxID=10224 RepID=A0ABM0GGV8_SACKO|nr:coatomer subunit delta [Saccoglossus kowalevskii]
MVLLAAAVCTKSGKPILSRQFVEMTRSRVEGLLSAFPKLMNTGKQHTFVETESVRYVYQPIEKLYMLLITTKASNILEDLETLRLFSRVIPEYCRLMEECEILDHSFELIFAFDEIVALGYRENVNLAQIRTFTEMDSHEEKVFQAVRQTQEREANIEMRRKAKELQQRRREAEKMGKIRSSGFSGFGSSSKSSDMAIPMIGDSASHSEIHKASSIPTKPIGSGRAMKLGSRSKDVDSFVDKLRTEGEDVISPNKSRQSANVVKTTTPVSNTESVHVRVEEKISLTVGRDGGLHNMEVHGLVLLRISDEQFGRIKIAINNNNTKGAQLQTHPNVDKKLFAANSSIGMKNPAKPFPLNNDVGVLKWRLQTQDDSYMPLSINCWPSENSEGGCDVNMEYTLEQDDLELQDVSFAIPLPSGVGAPIIGEIDGNYHHNHRHNILEWSLPVIDVNNKTGTLEFSIAGHPNDFFPINVNFVSRKSFCGIEVADVSMVDEQRSVKYSSDVAFFVDKYEVV